MNRYLILTFYVFIHITLALPQSVQAVQPIPKHQNHYWEKAIQNFEKQDKIKFPDSGQILFVGSSSIRMWKSLNEDMKPLKVINRGFGGSTFPDVLHFFDRLVLPYKPKVILIYEGDNDLAGKSPHTPETVLKNFQKFVKKVKAKLPETKVYFISIKPSISRWKIWPSMARANQLIKAFAETEQSVGFFDVSTPMLNREGVKKELFISDGLHMNKEGYTIWTNVIKAELLKVKSSK